MAPITQPALYVKENDKKIKLSGNSIVPITIIDGQDRAYYSQIRLHWERIANSGSMKLFSNDHSNKREGIRTGGKTVWEAFKREDNIGNGNTVGGRTVHEDQGDQRKTTRSIDAKIAADNRQFPFNRNLGMTTSECFASKDGACTRDEMVLQAAAEFADTIDGNAEGGKKTNGKTSNESSSVPIEEKIKKAIKKTKCDSESCLLHDKSFKAFAKGRGVTLGQINRTLEIDFKTEGPRDEIEWLSNIHIDDTLGRWAREYDNFFPFPFAMMDFADYKHELVTIPLADILDGKVDINMGPMVDTIKRPSKCMGCVLNTDVSTGKGKHWVVVFVDCRDQKEWSIEYFNSTGNKIPKAVKRWFVSAKEQLTEYANKHNLKVNINIVEVTVVGHQTQDSECGVYSLFYIRRRLEGTPYTFFTDLDKRISDDYMVEFRRFLFRHH